MFIYNMQPYLETIDKVIAKGPFDASWESLSGYQVPTWYQNAKFGFLSTGEFIVYQRLEVNGTPEICIFREVQNMSII